MTIALLNVCSITSKLTDLQSDEMLKYASVVCFCETWLKPSDPSPVLLDNHIVLRSDRQHHNNKGGVLMSVLQLLKPGFILRSSSFGIESLAVKVELPNYCLQIALVYRPPAAPVHALFSTLRELLAMITISDLPTVVLGDFNECLLAVQSKHFSHYGFSQLVTSPTNDSGSQTDHVYFNKASNNVVVEVTDCYFSDHDFVYCSFPLNPMLPIHRVLVFSVYR